MLVFPSGSLIHIAHAFMRASRMLLNVMAMTGSRAGCRPSATKEDRFFFIWASFFGQFCFCVPDRPVNSTLEGDGNSGVDLGDCDRAAFFALDSRLKIQMLSRESAEPE